MPYQPKTENESYAQLLCGHLERLVNRLSEIPADKWDWAPTPSAPTARQISQHAWQWLQSDRQHIREPDISRHQRIPEPPREPSAMCAAMREEMEQWRSLIQGMTPQQFEEDRFLFGTDDALNV